MKLSLIIIVLVITVGFFVASSGIGQGSMLFTFVAAFGLFMLIIIVGMFLAAKKQKDDNES